MLRRRNLLVNDEVLPMKQILSYAIDMTPEKIFEHIWAEFKARLETLRAQTPKMTYEQLGVLCGVSKATTKRWLDNDMGGEKTPFPDMLRYMEAVGMNIAPFTALIETSNFDAEADRSVVLELAECKRKIADLEKERDQYRNKWEGHLEGLQATARAQEEAKLAADMPLRKTG